MSRIERDTGSLLIRDFLRDDEIAALSARAESLLFDPVRETKRRNERVVLADAERAADWSARLAGIAPEQTEGGWMLHGVSPGFRDYQYGRLPGGDPVAGPV